MTGTMSDAHWNLVSNFRTATVITMRDEETGRVLPALDAVGVWLREFHLAFIEANHVVNDDRLHAFTGRRLVLTGDHLLPEFVGVGDLCDIARQCGIGVTLSLTLDGVARYALALATLRSAHPMLQLQIDCSSLSTVGLAPDRRAAYVAALRSFAGSGGELNLVGDVAPLRAAGLMDSEEFNRCGFTVAALPEGVRPVHRLHDVSPCRELIALYVDPCGDIYPCAGMVGHMASRLGTLSAPFSELLRGLAETRRSIELLSPLGPRIASPIAARIDRFPVDLCALHRLTVDSLTAL